jgi:hypothetical protein
MNINTKTRSELKTYFRKNSIPTQSNFADLIDATPNAKDDGLVKTAGNPLSIEAGTSNIKPLLNLYLDLEDPTPVFALALGANESTAEGFSINDKGGNSHLFIAQNSGNVGIGTLTPQAELDVAGDIKAQGALIPSIGNSINNGIAFPRISGDIAAIRYYSQGSGKTLLALNNSNDTNDHIALMATGNVGINTADPKATLHIDSNLNVTKSAVSGALIIGHSSSKHLAFANDEIMAKKSVSKAGTLFLQKEGGKVEIGGTLKVVNRIEQESWKSVSFLNNWKNHSSSTYNTAGYFKDSQGLVHLKGLIVGKGLNIIFRLEAGYRPSARELHCAIANNNIARIDVENNGNVRLVSGAHTDVSLDGITFRAGTAAFVRPNPIGGIDILAPIVGPLQPTPIIGPLIPPRRL